MQVLVLAPHPDDEVLGVGGTIARLKSEGHAVVVAIATKGWPPLFAEAQVNRVRHEAHAAATLLGIDELRFLDLPVTQLQSLPVHELNGVIDELMQDVRPELVFLPFNGDRHSDHQALFQAALVALRPPRAPFARRILCYETVSETHWAAPMIEPNFVPSVWYDISSFLDKKLEAMRCYASQVPEPPHARSLKAIESLATWRGSVAGLYAAECFFLVRDVL